MLIHASGYKYRATKNALYYCDTGENGAINGNGLNAGKSICSKIQCENNLVEYAGSGRTERAIDFFEDLQHGPIHYCEDNQRPAAGPMHLIRVFR